MRRRRLLAAALVAGAALVAVEVNASGAPQSAAGSCLGLACPDAERDVPEARGPVTSLSGPHQLKQQGQAGFYEYGLLNPLHGERAVAYVVPPGQASRMPSSVRDLPVVKSLATDTTYFEDGSTVFIVDRHIFGAIPPATTPARATRFRRAGSQPRRRRARSAHVVNNCPDNYFCIYDFENNTGERWGLHGIGTGWISLSACCGFNDRAESVHNNRARDSLLNKHNPPSDAASDRYCSDSDSVDFSLDNNFGGGGNNDASMWANLDNDGRC
jgi:hypothetical protein